MMLVGKGLLSRGSCAANAAVEAVIACSGAFGMATASLCYEPI